MPMYTDVAIDIPISSLTATSSYSSHNEPGYSLYAIPVVQLYGMPVIVARGKMPTSDIAVEKMS